MPRRTEIFTNGGYYHLFNKTIENKNIFVDTKQAQLFKNLIKYYQLQEINCKYSKRNLPKTKNLLKKPEKKLVNILCYCLMPNHFHLLVKQEAEQGITQFISKVINAFTRTYNEINHRKGPLFISRFKAVRIYTEAQLLHVSRYIHLNLYSSGIVQSLTELRTSPNCSLREYLNLQADFCDIQKILCFFNNSPEKYFKFISDHSEYQKTIEYNKHIQMWEK